MNPLDQKTNGKSPCHSAAQVSNLRVINVGYLNAVPFSNLTKLPWVDYKELSPAECARALHEGEADIGCIPLVECIAFGGYNFLPFGIVAKGAVASVRFLSDRPLNELDTIYLDGSSYTSIILFQLLFGNQLENIALHRVTSDRIAGLIGQTSGALVIGDQALRLRGKYQHEIDLSEKWWEETGLPFVFAVWAYKDQELCESHHECLIETFDQGIEARTELATSWANNNNFSPEIAMRYIRENVYHVLDEAAWLGIAEFVKRGVAAGFFPQESLASIAIPVRNKEQHVKRKLPWQPSILPVWAILESATAGHRISASQALTLAEQASFADLALAADAIRFSQHPDNAVSYIVDRNINYTNICNVYCRFCAFYEAPGKPDGYILSKDEIGQKIEETLAAGGIQILLQGGLNPELKIDYYEDLFRWIKSNYPVNLHSLSSDEILHIAKVSNLSIEATLSRLIEAGLGSLPGGGAEILVDSVRKRIARLKSSSEDWLDVHRTAHRLGITSTCTMMFGVEETWLDRVNHLYKLRRLQDETGGFTAFIAWSFQDENTKLKKGDTSATEYLRVQSLSRIFLDNIDNVQASWVTQGPAVGQVALSFGANDFGSVMFEENVVSAAGTTYHMNEELIRKHIIDAGFAPWRRTVHYKPALGDR